MSSANSLRTCHCLQSHTKCIQLAPHTGPSEVPQSLSCSTLGTASPLTGRSRRLQPQRKQLDTYSLWILRSEALLQDKMMPVASQRETWVGIARSHSCQSYAVCKWQIHQPTCPAFTVALPIAVRTAHPANTRQPFLRSNCFVVCMHFKVAAL